MAITCELFQRWNASTEAFFRQGKRQRARSRVHLRGCENCAMFLFLLPADPGRDHAADRKMCEKLSWEDAAKLAEVRKVKGELVAIERKLLSMMKPGLYIMGGTVYRVTERQTTRQPHPQRIEELGPVANQELTS